MNLPDHKKIESTYGCPIDWKQSRIITTTDVLPYLHQRPYNSHKGTFGNAGMATAGSGDVLTGILVALLAQNHTPREACMLSTFIHGLSGDIAASILGETSLISSDIVHNLPQAFEALNGQNHT